VDSAQSPIDAMTHHVLHVHHDHRLPVLVDLAAAPGRTLMFTRTKHGAKRLARQLVSSGVPAVELHGNLSQNARTRNLDAFSDGSATTMVATDIAARGIHVDDIRLVVHADPPVEHKAYLHRSGRTARAGADGTVVTLMTDAQVADVRMLTRKAGIKPTTTRLQAGHPLLAELAPGERTFVVHTTKAPVAASSPAPARGGNSSRRRRKPASGGSASTQSSAKRSSSNRSGSNRSGSNRAATTRSSSKGGAAAFSAGSRPGRRTR
ncbi:MAG: helicase-related protein, partial [Nocardioidaceae bacterium]